MTTKRRDALELLEKLTGGPLTLGEFLASIRKGEDWSLADMGHKIGISRTHLWEIEHNKRTVSPGKAAEIAKRLGYDAGQMVELALQAVVDECRLKLVVHVQPA